MCRVGTIKGSVKQAMNFQQISLESGCNLKRQLW